MEHLEQMEEVKNIMSSVDWIKKNMLEPYVQNLDRPLTEPEIRVQRALERLSIPEWYRLYSKPIRILRRKSNAGDSTKKSTLRQKAAKFFVSKKSLSETLSSQESLEKHGSDEGYSTTKHHEESDGTADSFENLYDLKSNHKYPVEFYEEEEEEEEEEKATAASAIDYEEDKEILELLDNLRNVRFLSTIRKSNTFPRNSDSRKVSNINIVFPPNNNTLPINTEVAPERRYYEDIIEEDESSISDVSYSCEYESSEKKESSNSSYSATTVDDEINESISSNYSTCTPFKHHNYYASAKLDLSNGQYYACESSANGENKFVAKGRKNYASVLMADVAPEGLTEYLQLQAGLTDVSSSSFTTLNDSIAEEIGVYEDEDKYEDEEEEEEEENMEDTRSTITGSTLSLNTRFLRSQKKSRALEHIVKRKSTRVRSSLIQSMIEELERGLAKSEGFNTATGSLGGSNPSMSPSGSNFVKSMVSALEQLKTEPKEEDEFDYEDEEDEVVEEEYVTDPELPKSTDVSFGYNKPKHNSTVVYSDSDEDEEEEEEEDEKELSARPIWIPIYNEDEDANEEDEDIYEEDDTLPPIDRSIYKKSLPSNIPATSTLKLPASLRQPRNMARTSSRYSITPRSSSSSNSNEFACASGRCSPGLSPIRNASSYSPRNLPSVESVYEKVEGLKYSKLDSGYSSRMMYGSGKPSASSSSCDSLDLDLSASSSGLNKRLYEFKAIKSIYA